MTNLLRALGYQPRPKFSASSAAFLRVLCGKLLPALNCARTPNAGGRFASSQRPAIAPRESSSQASDVHVRRLRRFRGPLQPSRRHVLRPLRYRPRHAERSRRPRSPQRIRRRDSQAYVEQYGPTVLVEPPKKGFDLLAWMMPVLLPLIALILVWQVVRRWKQKAALAPAGGPPARRCIPEPASNAKRAGNRARTAMSSVDIAVACVLLSAAAIFFIFNVKLDESDSAPHRTKLDQLHGTPRRHLRKSARPPLRISRRKILRTRFRGDQAIAGSRSRPRPRRNGPTDRRHAHARHAPGIHASNPCGTSSRGEGYKIHERQANQPNV